LSYARVATFIARLLSTNPGPTPFQVKALLHVLRTNRAG
jgi:hypothetical protein